MAGRWYFLPRATFFWLAEFDPSAEMTFPSVKRDLLMFPVSFSISSSLCFSCDLKAVAGRPSACTLLWVSRSRSLPARSTKAILPNLIEGSSSGHHQYSSAYLQAR